MNTYSKDLLVLRRTEIEGVDVGICIICAASTIFFVKTSQVNAYIIRSSSCISVYVYQADEKQSIQKNEGHSKNKCIYVLVVAAKRYIYRWLRLLRWFRFPDHVKFDIDIYLKSLYSQMAQRLKESIDLHLSLLEFANHKYFR